MKPQVDASYYNFSDYVSSEQFLSYYNQLKLIYEINPSSMLEIGVGGNILENLLPRNIKYTGYDYDKNLYPTVQGNVEHLPFKDRAFELVTAFEVLEHLPFEKFENILREISRISKRHVIISLPYANYKFQISIYLPGIHKLELLFLIPKFNRKHKFDGIHYWEIGKMGFSKRHIQKKIENVFDIKNSLVSRDFTYHSFYMLEKRNI